jgi:hypothetical protein
MLFKYFNQDGFVELEGVVEVPQVHCQSLDDKVAQLLKLLLETQHTSPLEEHIVDLTHTGRFSEDAQLQSHWKLNLAQEFTGELYILIHLILVIFLLLPGSNQDSCFLLHLS